jgi:hypothetical protein
MLSLTDFGLHTAEEDIRRFVQNRLHSVLGTLQDQDHCKTREPCLLCLNCSVSSLKNDNRSLFVSQELIEKGEKQPNITISIVASVVVVLVSVLFRTLFGGKKAAVCYSGSTSIALLQT